VGKEESNLSETAVSTLLGFCQEYTPTGVWVKQWAPECVGVGFNGARGGKMPGFLAQKLAKCAF